MRLSGLVSLRAEVGSGGSTLGEVACEEGMYDRSKNDLSPTIGYHVSMPTIHRGVSESYPV